MAENQIEKLERLKSLYESGTISKEEMEKLKKDVFVNHEKITSNSSVKKGVKRKYIFFLIGISLIGAIVLIILNKDKLEFNNEVKNDLSFYELKGNVKFTITSEDESFKSNNVQGFNKEGFLVYENNFNGYEIKTISRDINNQITFSKFIQNQSDEGILYQNIIESHYKYNEQNQLIEKKESGTMYNCDYSNISNFFYDEKGNVIKQTSFNDTNEYVFKYDNNDSIIEEIDKSFGTKSKFSYNENGWLIERKEFDDKGKLGRRELYKYDEAGNKTEEIYYNEGVKIKSTRYIFDDANNLIRQDENWKNSGWKKKVEYENDNYGNWIKKTNFDEEGEASYIFRKIEYYSEDELKSKEQFDFTTKFGSSQSEDNEKEEMSNSSNSYGEIRGRLIGGNSNMVERELGEPTFKSSATNFIKDTYNMSLPIGLFDLCLEYKVYYYENYFGESQHLLVILSKNGKVTNVMPEADVQDVKDICCCD